MIEFIIDQIDDIFVVRIQIVRATLNNASAFKETLLELIEQGHKKLIVDCINVEFMDSTFLGSMVVALKKLNAVGGDLRIVFANKETPVWLMFETTRMVKVFNSFLSIDEAVESFNTSE